MSRLKRRKMIVTCLMSTTIAFVLVGCDACSAPQSARNQSANATRQETSTVDWKKVDQAMGRTGTMMPGDVYRFSMPRSDLHVTVKGVEIKPALALGSWVAFKAMTENEVMVMGDMVLAEDEVSPVMLKLQESGIEQSALHHHVLYESPRVLYMHIMGHGDPVKIAQAINAALILTKTPSTPRQQTPIAKNDAESGSPAASSGGNQSQDIGIDTQQIEGIVGHSGKVNGGVFQISVPRAEKIMDSGMELPPSMGAATALNFQPTGEGKAAITGDFVLIANEVNPVIRALRANGIEVTSLHNHMLNDSPRIFFMHFWANDNALKLAHGLRAALDATNSAKNQAK